GRGRAGASARRSAGRRWRDETCLGTVPGRGRGGQVMSVLTGTPLLPTYARFPVTFVDGDGSWLIADDGQRYLDLVAGIAVVSLGHCHPAPLEAARAQLERLWHGSNLYATEPSENQGERLDPRVGGGQSRPGQ